jgi:uncharacterized Rmd1/YagE family protein
MKNLEEILQRIEDKMIEIELRIQFLEERVEVIDDENDTINYWTGRYVASICDLINRKDDNNEK